MDGVRGEFVENNPSIDSCSLQELGTECAKEAIMDLIDLTKQNLLLTLAFLLSQMPQLHIRIVAAAPQRFTRTTLSVQKDMDVWISS